ncbi:alpha/beta hydrolase [Neobacillus sp.]|uniref:alpha/beta fold hydrolase n=1 Tax=Neobacillus sp. TaxID=2675273 RepID=UPI0028981B68|nr:alpha/beta hydrolase [Neobacillus sp.]
MKKNTIYKKEKGKKIIEQHYEKYLLDLSIDFERIYIYTTFGKTHMLVSGPLEGKPIFIFQGGNCINPMTLSWFLPLFSKYRIYSPDTIGHPGYSDQTRVSAKDSSFAQWISELMNHFNIESSAFIGPSYGAGIILRLASFMPQKIDCTVLVSPAGLQLGSKQEMIKKVLLPLFLYKISSNNKYLHKLTNNMSENNMNELDKQIIGDIFKYIKLEQEMPKLTEKKELVNFNAPTLILAGTKDIFFPANSLRSVSEEIISNLISFQSFEMGHFPSNRNLEKINEKIIEFLNIYY